MDRGIVDSFRDDGAVVLRGVVSAHWLAALAEGVEFNRANPSEWSHWYTDADEAVGFWSDYVTWPRVEQYRRVVFDSGLADLAADLMRSEQVRFFHEHVLVKEPGASERTPWHHDEPYYGIDGAQNVSMWIALDPVPATSGLRFIAGSHRWDRLFVPRRVRRPHPVRRRSRRHPLRVHPRPRRRDRRAPPAVVGCRARRRDRVPLPHPPRRTGQPPRHAATGGESALARRRRECSRLRPWSHVAAVSGQTAWRWVGRSTAIPDSRSCRSSDSARPTSDRHDVAMTVTDPSDLVRPDLPRAFDNRVTRDLGVDDPDRAGADGLDRPQPAGVGGLPTPGRAGSSRRRRASSTPSRTRSARCATSPTSRSA